jgi:hypothetical protein
MIKFVLLYPNVIQVFENGVKIYEGTCLKSAQQSTIPF